MPVASLAEHDEERLTDAVDHGWGHLLPSVGMLIHFACCEWLPAGSVKGMPPSEHQTRENASDPQPIVHWLRSPPV
jgi:hypothetical protein